ncbi:hypothetical protein LINPERPRIM_LOCUS22772 [Linum perenne]
MISNRRSLERNFTKATGTIAISSPERRRLRAVFLVVGRSDADTCGSQQIRAFSSSAETTTGRFPVAEAGNSLYSEDYSSRESKATLTLLRFSFPARRSCRWRQRLRGSL